MAWIVAEVCEDGHEEFVRFFHRREEGNPRVREEGSHDPRFRKARNLGHPAVLGWGTRPRKHCDPFLLVHLSVIVDFPLTGPNVS